MAVWRSPQRPWSPVQVSTSTSFVTLLQLPSSPPYSTFIFSCQLPFALLLLPPAHTPHISCLTVFIYSFRIAGDMLKSMETVFSQAEATAARYHERLEAERQAREAAAKDIVAGLGGAMVSGSDNVSFQYLRVLPIRYVSVVRQILPPLSFVHPTISSLNSSPPHPFLFFMKGSSDPLVSVAESIESILASIVSDVVDNGTA